MPLSPECQDLVGRWPLIELFQPPADSTIVVVGAYKGLAIETLAQLYPDYKKIIAFEPQIWAAKESEDRLRDYRDCIVIAAGLWAGIPEHEVMPMGEWHTDACSFINTGPNARQHGHGIVIDAAMSLDELVDNIDLMIMNIESYEYELLPYLNDIGWLDRIDRIAVQFHLDLGNDQNCADVLNMMDSKYTRSYSEFPAWVYWVKE